MRHIAERLAEPVVSPHVQLLQPANHGHLHLRLAVKVRLLRNAPERRVQQVAQPDGHRRRHHFGAFRFQPALDVVVAVAFMRLQPELAGDFHFRLHLQAVDFDRVEFLAHHAQRIREIAGEEMPRQHPVLVVAKRPLLENLEEIVRAFLQDLVGLRRD